MYIENPLEIRTIFPNNKYFIGFVEYEYNTSFEFYNGINFLDLIEMILNVWKDR